MGTINGTSGNDSLNGTTGNDTVYGGAGNDTIYGGGGNDVIDSGTGNDSVYGGEGADSLIGGTGSGLFDGGEGNDTILFGAGNDTVYGGEGNDVMDDVSGAQLTGTNLIYGDAGNDTAWAGYGDDTLYGGDGNDWLSGEGDNDSLYGDTGTDTLYGGDGNDKLFGGAGNDKLYGDAGNDTLKGGNGNDTLTGGAGADLFRMEAAGGADHVTDFNISLVGGKTTDQLDVSGLTDAHGEPIKAFDVTVGDDGHGNAVLAFPGGEVVVLDGVSPATVNQPGMLVKMGIPCFAAGTRIAVPGGWRPVEALRPGDLVVTPDGPRPVLWTACRRVEAAELAARPELRPIRLRAGYYGLTRDLVVSAQHAMAVNGRLIRARHLAEYGAGARLALGLRRIRYHHLLLPAHALVLAEGAWSESFHPGPEAVRALTPADRALLRRALGAAPGEDLAARHGPRCLPLLSGREARALLREEANQPGPERRPTAPMPRDAAPVPGLVPALTASP